MKVYLVEKDHLCDDPHYQAPPWCEGVYASRQSAQAVVDAYIANCKRNYIRINNLAEDVKIDPNELWGSWYALKWVRELEVQP